MLSRRLNLAGVRQSLASARRILVVDLGFLGDTIHTLPALWELKQALPNTELHVLSTPVGCEILNMAGSVDRPVSFPLKNPSPPWWKHTDVLRSLRRERFDAALSFNGSDRNLFITALSGARIKVLHDEGRPHFWRTWLVRGWVPRRSRSLTVLEQRRQVLACLGFDLHPVAFDLRVDTEQRDWARANVPPSGLHFSINASSHIKEWPLSHWAELTTSILDELPNCTVVATASRAAREQERLSQFAAALPERLRSRLVTFAESLPIPRLAAVLERCVIHVGADSGVLHLAVALGVPTVSIFRDYEGLKEWQPRGPLHRCVVRHCVCEATKSWGAECASTARCLSEIPVTEVKPLIHELLAAAEDY